MVAGLNQTFTCEWNTHVPTWKDIVKSCVIVCVSLCIIIGNVFSCVVFRSRVGQKLFLKKIRLTMNSLICTDLCMGLLMCPFCVYSALYRCWPYTETFCKIEALLISALFHESTMSLVLIALDRYFSVFHNLKYTIFMTSRKYVLAIVLTWLVTFGVYAAVIFYWQQFYFDDVGINCEPYYENRNVALTVIVAFYFVPSLLFLYVYGSIFAVVNRKKDILLVSWNRKILINKNHAVSQILRTSKYLAAISIGFFVAISPWTISTFVIALTDVKLDKDIDFTFTWVAISNSFLNFVIYCVMNRKFRQAAMSLTNPKNCCKVFRLPTENMVQPRLTDQTYGGNQSSLTLSNMRYSLDALPEPYLISFNYVDSGM